MAFATLRRFGSVKPVRKADEEAAAAPAIGISRDRSRIITSAETPARLPSEHVDEYDTLCKRWKDMAHFIEELPKISASTKSAGASTGSARRDIQDGLKVCGQQLQSDLSMPLSVGHALTDIGSLLEMVNDKLFEGERDMPDSISRVASDHLNHSFPALKRSVDEVAKSHAHLQSCVAACETASNTPQDHHRLYTAAQAKYAAQHRYDCRLSSALELLSSALATCEMDVHRLLIHTSEAAAGAMSTLKAKMDELEAGTWSNTRALLEKRKEDYAQEEKLEKEQLQHQQDKQYAERYHELLDLLCEGVAEGLLNAADGDGRSVELLARVLDAYDRGYPLMMKVIAHEVDTTSSPATLLRENNFASKMTIGYLKLITHNYISPISEIIQQILNDPKSYEVDPQKTGEGVDVEANMQTLIAASSAFLDTVVNSIENAPKVLRELLRHLYDGAEKKWPGKGYTAVGGFLFLRLICPALVFPEKNNLVPEGVVPDNDGRRGLMLVSKALQNLANGKKFREPYMEALNEWFDSRVDSLRAYLEEIIVVPHYAPVFNLATVDEVNANEIPELVRLLVEKIEPVCGKLERNHKELIPKLPIVLGQVTRWVEVENPQPAPKA
eukprot:TRINITY_DN319_c2_g1_i5.p1 TRINITY_DN319_c2_g1~~TRINITY_DN319_c2_g1_i5.p1  ORF type:complete len:613 (+),score=170.51 TRINITY_DN319_c2_g1_i5:35-1873(+)